MTRRKKIYIGLFAALLIFVIIPMVGIFFIERWIVFPAPDRIGPAATVDGFAPVLIETPDGEQLKALYHPPGAQAASILVFHGSAEIAADQLPRGKALAAAGFGVLLAEYRGYGGSSGRPSEEGVISDGLAAFDYLAAQGPEPIGILGQSIGAAVAIPVAAARTPFAVVLQSPFLSLIEVTRYRVGIAPFEFLMRYPFRSDKRIGEVKAPILIIHGTADKVAPFEQGEKLATLAPRGTAFIKIEGGGHNDLAKFDDMIPILTYFKRQNPVAAASRKATAD